MAVKFNLVRTSTILMRSSRARIPPQNSWKKRSFLPFDMEWWEAIQASFPSAGRSRERRVSCATLQKLLLLGAWKFSSNSQGKNREYRWFLWSGLQFWPVPSQLEKRPALFLGLLARYGDLLSSSISCLHLGIEDSFGLARERWPRNRMSDFQLDIPFPWLHARNLFSESVTALFNCNSRLKRKSVKLRI